MCVCVRVCLSLCVCVCSGRRAISHQWQTAWPLEKPQRGWQRQSRALPDSRSINSEKSHWIWPYAGHIAVCSKYTKALPVHKFLNFSPATFSAVLRNQTSSIVSFYFFRMFSFFFFSPATFSAVLWNQTSSILLFLFCLFFTVYFFFFSPATFSAVWRNQTSSILRAKPWQN